MNETMRLVLSLSLSASILAVLIFAIKPFIKNKLVKSVQYYIWVLVLLRLVIPFSFESSIMNYVFYNDKASYDVSIEDTSPSMTGIGESSIYSSILPNVEQNAAKGVYNNDTDHSRYLRDLLNQYVLYLWLVGMIIVLAVNLTGYIRFSNYLKQENKPATEEQNRILADLLNGRHKVRLVRNKLVTTPMLIGILRPCIVIPDIDFNPKQLKNILLHEVIHLKRFDIAVKWLTMIAVSIHWFNPLVYFIKKEVDRACELSCDEAVIKNLDSAEKQAYGETLIDVSAETNYPTGVLQATMSEDKATLKERLVAIMKHNKKSKITAIVSGLLFLLVLIGALYLGAGAGIGMSAPPKIYISAEGERTKEALTGSYSWKYLNRIVHAGSDNPVNFKYKLDNIVSVKANQKMVIGTQKIHADKKYEFTLDQISVYKDGKPVNAGPVKPSFLNGNLYLQAPSESGEYIYTLVLKFGDRGTVSYGFVVRVDMLTYDLTDIAKYKTPYVGNHSKDGQISSRLPLIDKYFKQQYISLETKERPYGLTVYYEAASDNDYPGKWPLDTANSELNSNLNKNALVLFCMIGNLDKVTFAFRNSQSNGKLDESKYDSKFTFQRTSFEKQYGDLSVLGNDLDLLQEILQEKKSAFKGLELYVWRRPELTGSNNLYYTLLLGTNLNKTESEIYNLDAATSDLNLIKQELSKYRNGTYLSIIHDMNIDKETMSKIGDQLSGIIKNGSISIGGRELNKDLVIESQIPDFTDAEVASARAVVKEYFRAIAAKDDKAILKTLTPMYNHPNVVLYGNETCSLLSVDYSADDPMRESYIKYGRGSKNGTKKENVIVFKVSFNVKYPEGVSGSFNEGDYTNWNMILIRGGRTSPWLIDSQGI